MGTAALYYLVVMLLNSANVRNRRCPGILGLVGFVFRIVGVEGFVRYIQVREQEGFRQIQVAVGILRRSVAGRGGYGYTYRRCRR